MAVKLTVLIVSGVFLIFIAAIAARVAFNLARSRMRGIAKAGGKIPASLKKFIYFWYAWVDGQTIYSENEEERRSIPIHEIVAIRFHYEAIAGFNEWLELVPPDGNSIIIDLKVDGMTEVLQFLSENFEQLTRAKLDECISNGDVTDSCTIWARPSA